MLRALVGMSALALVAICAATVASAETVQVRPNAGRGDTVTVAPVSGAGSGAAPASASSDRYAANDSPAANPNPQLVQPPTPKESAMSAVDVKQIVETVLRNVEMPPSEKYSAYAYGAYVARQLDAKDASALIIENFRSLPASLAASFLDGVLDHVSIPHLNDALFAALPQAADVTAGGTIVRFLADRTRMPRLSVVTRLISEMQLTTDPHVQNVTAYAIFKALGNRHSAISSAQTAEDKIVDALLDSVLGDVSQNVLSEYARGLLQRCRQ
jgi:hypothetical protein